MCESLHPCLNLELQLQAFYGLQIYLTSHGIDPINWVPGISATPADSRSAHRQWGLVSLKRQKKHNKNTRIRAKTDSNNNSSSSSSSTSNNNKKKNKKNKKNKNKRTKSTATSSRHNRNNTKTSTKPSSFILFFKSIVLPKPRYAPLPSTRLSCLHTFPEN